MVFALPLLLSLPVAWQTSPPPALAPVPVSVGSPPVPPSLPSPWPPLLPLSPGFVAAASDAALRNLIDGLLGSSAAVDLRLLLLAACCGLLERAARLGARGRSGWLAKRVGRPAKRVGSRCGVPFVLLLLAHLASIPGVSSLASPPPPAAPLPPLQLTGPCSLTDGDLCAVSPNYPNRYGNNEACTISGVPPVRLETVAFDVAGWGGDCAWDYLAVNGTKYCGTSGPQDAVAENGVIKWVSMFVGIYNFNDTTGWKACPGFSHTPTASRL